ncbi:MAG: glycosyltransferase family 1 protein [Nostocaceae cyanobacterium]|nr:glycosyltransferase family 1 protein [Nostocaceae cyanobacterium]
MHSTELQLKRGLLTLEGGQGRIASLPIRILHVLGGMNRGGVETWLMHILRHIDRKHFQMDFLVHTTESCAYDEEIRALGSKIIPCLHPSQPLLYARNFQQIWHEYGPYDIVHSHVHHYSGYVLRLAKRVGVPTSIAHSHNDISPLQAKAGWFRRLYLTVTASWVARYATLGLACSDKAAASLFGANWQAHTHRLVLPYGVDLAPFQDAVEKDTVRAEFDIPADAFVIGHVGRFDTQKNHGFLLEIAAAVVKKEPKTRLLLVGDGSLRTEIAAQVQQLDLSENIIFAGIRSDVPRLMLGAMDVFLFPSLHEGLGLVLLEAQAAGLPCIFSDVVPQEADVVKPLVKRISLSQSPEKWAEEILQQRSRRPKINQSEALALVKNSPFNIENAVKQLEEIYYVANSD